MASAPGNSNNSNANSNAEAVRTVRDTMARLNEQEEQRAAARLRPLEDPHLVGEEAAARARRARLARENGDEILIREDRRWDWFLGTFQLYFPLLTFYFFLCFFGLATEGLPSYFVRKGLSVPCFKKCQKSPRATTTTITKKFTDSRPSVFSQSIRDGTTISRAERL